MSDLNSLTLDDLLNSLGAGLMKAASDDECKDEKKEDKSDKDESKEKKDLPAFMQKKDGDKDEKEDKDEKSEDKEGQTKEASDAGAALAREIMAKVASTKVETINPMNKQASVAGQALAQALLQKKAYAGDMTTQNGVVPGTAGSKVIADNAQMEAEGASYIKPMLLSDGIRNSGTVNEIFDAVIADAVGQGATGDEQVHQTGVAAQEGNVEDHAVPNQVKVAYMNELLEQGMDFDKAAEMVKAAGEHKLKAWVSPAWQENAIAKEHGKEGDAGVGKHITGTLRAAGRATLEGVAGAALGTGAGMVANRMSRGRLGPMAAGAGYLVGANVGGVHGAVASYKNQAAEAHKKYASMNELLEQGVDFDEAADMVKSAAEQEASDNLEKAAAINELVGRGHDFEDAVALVKQAAEEIEDEMEKAATLGNLIAQGVDFDEAIEMIKEASAGDMTTQDGVSAGTQPNKNIVDNAQMNAEGDSYIKPMPTGDGIRNSGSLNQIFDAVISDAMGQGATGDEQVHQTGTASQEGKVEDLAVPNQVKVAAMNRLLEDGFDFDAASELIKKAAAVAGEVVGEAPAKKFAGKFSNASSKTLSTSREVGPAKKGIGLAMARMSGKTKLGLAVGGAAALAGGAMAMRGREKKAAFDALVEGGVDFDTAAALVSAKAKELYGE